MEIDPVCGMEVDPKSAAGSFDYHGTEYYFCSAGCLEDFKEDPERYVGS
jgi:Cu+-exporting ATPase